MGIFRKIHRFLRKDFPERFYSLPLGVQIPVLVLGIPAAGFVLLILFIHLMALSSSNETYELIRPVSDIDRLEIVCIQNDVDLYGYPTAEIPQLLDQFTGDSIVLEANIHPNFWANFRDIQCLAWWNDPCPYISQGTIRISYFDGSREWICADGTFYYDASSGKSSMTNKYFNKEEFALLLQKYGYQTS